MPFILHIVADGTPGGGTTNNLGLCKSLLAKTGWRVGLVTAPGSYMEAQGQKIPGLETHNFDFFTSLFDPRLADGLKQLLKRLQPDLIHFHGARGAHWMTSRKLDGIKTPVINTVHGYHFPNKGLALKILGWLAERKISRRMDCTVFVSEGDKNVARRWGLLPRMRKTKVIYNGINVDACDGLAATPKKYDLAFMARLHHQKNPTFMIDIMKELQPDGIKLIMIGGGELEPQTRTYAAEQGVTGSITFTGKLPNTESVQALASARIYVLPSLWEGMPLAPMEAMACGLPVVASDIPGTDEVVQDRQTGRLIKNFDARAYADAIRDILKDPATLASYAQQALHVVDQRFRQSRGVDAYIELYKELLQIPG